MVKRFPSFTLDAANQTVVRGGEAIQLTPKAFSVLAYLVENPGRIVTKEELLNAVWGETFVQEAVLKTCVLDVRKALGENPKDPKCIETVYRRGYRFLETPVDITPKSNRLLGRGKELARLRELLDRAAARQRQVVFVTGEPGIGKSTLMNHFLESAGAARILRGQCVEHFGAREAYYPIFDALARGAREIPGLTGILRTYAPTWLFEMPGVASPGDREALKLETVGATRDRMLREVSEAIESLAERELLVIVLEDLHWSDLATIDLISRIANRVESAKLLLLASYRPVDVILNNHPIRSLKQGLLAHGRCCELPLELLSRNDVAGILSGRFARHQFPETFAELVHTRTDGNPLFVHNLLDYAVSKAHISERDGAWTLQETDLGVPDSLSQMIERQIERLTPQEQEVLEAASAVGTTFAIALIADEESAEECCDEMAKRDLFVRAAGIASIGNQSVSAQFQFTHALYRDVFYRRLSEIQRIRLHRTIGERLEKLFSGRWNEASPDLALHFQECRDSERAILYLRMVAQRCAGRHAHMEALNALTRAMSIAEDLPAPRRQAVKVELTLQAGLVRRLMGQLTSAAEEFEKVFADATDAESRLRSQLELASVSSWLDRKRCLGAVDRIMRLCEGDVDASLRTNALGQVAYWNLLFRGWDERDAKASQDALDRARAQDDRTAIALHASRHAFFQCLSSRYLEACETAREGIRVAMSFDSLVDYSIGYYFEAVSLLHAGEWGVLRHRLKTAIEMARRNGHDLWEMLFGLVEAYLHIAAFSYEYARDACERYLVRARELKHPLSIQMSLIFSGRAHLGTGELKAARDRLEEIRDWQLRERILMDWVWALPMQLGLTQLCLAEGDLNAADGEAVRFLAIASKTSEKTWIALAHYASAAVASAKGDEGLVREAVNRGLAVIDGVHAPMAAWRLQMLNGSEGVVRGREILAGLSNTLSAEDPLRESIRSASATYGRVAGA